MPFKIEIHTEPHFKATINAKFEPKRVNFHDFFSFLELRPKKDFLVHETVVLNLMHTIVVCLVDCY